jgi:heme-degrading monooxygenase HmoA
MAGRMVTLARQQPGFIGMESVRGEDGFGLTGSYWESEAAIRRWKAQAEHLEAQRRGCENWYSSFDLRVGRIERSHGVIGSADTAPCPQS